MTDQNTDIAKGKILAYLLMSRQPVTVNVLQLSEKLKLTPEQVTVALRTLEAEVRATVTISRAIVQLIDEPQTALNPPDDTEWEKSTQATLDAEAAAAKAEKKAGKNATA
jgi:hypothetical protein